MVCQVALLMEVLLSPLNQKYLASPSALCDVRLVSAKFNIHQSVFLTGGLYFHKLLSSPPAFPPFPIVSSFVCPLVSRVWEQSSIVQKALLDPLDYNHISSPQAYRGTEAVSEAGLSLQVPSLVDLAGQNNIMKNKNRQVRGDGMDKLNVRAEGAQTTRISLSFPVSVGLPELSAQNHCPLSPSPPSTSAHDQGFENTVWKMETSRAKQLSQLPSKSEHAPRFPVDLTAPVRKHCKSNLSLSVAHPETKFQTSSLGTPSESDVDYSRETSSGSLQNGTNLEHSTTETAHILFNLSARAYQTQGTKDSDHFKGKKGKGNSLPVGLSFPKPNTKPASTTSPPPLLPSLAQTPPTLAPCSPPSVNEHSQEMPKPELLCGVCHRLFSTASSLTVHMRLHRGGRALSCRHCSKVFIHNKRLQSHEAMCKQAMPDLPVQLKQEALEVGEVVGDRVIKVEETTESTQEEGPGRPSKKGRGLLGRHRVSFSRGDLMGEGDHFAKVVDGHIIYFCTVCERSYMTLSSLKRHSNVHSWRRKYPCHYCDKVFALAEYRTKHEVWHTGERRYQCIFCWEAFATYYNLKTHQKAFHGISPGIISSEKTANGGYKQKVNAIKLYRLLPMRSQKRPYKTYSQSLADGLLLSPDTSVSLPLDCGLPPNLNPSDLQSFSDIHTQGLKLDPEGFHISMSLEQDKASKLATSQTSRPAGVNEREGSDFGQSGCSSERVKSPRKTESVSSVITFGHTKPSVIVHGTAVSSSVIVHSNQISTGGMIPPLDIPSLKDSNQPITKVVQRQTKTQEQREHTDILRRQDAASSKRSDVSNRQSTETGKPHKGRKAHSKSSSGKIALVAGGSEVKVSGPLCQITVRIGEEAIVKRSISETDLMRDKSPPPYKTRKSDHSPEDHRESRHSHHHRQKHCAHRRFSQEDEGEPSQSSPKSPGKVREYYFRQEVREQDSDNDGEDNLWRPYYSYKPKRKVQQLQKVKSWQRKLHYKRSLRLMRRAERLTNHANKKIDGEEDKKQTEAKEGEEGEKDMLDQEKEYVKATTDTHPFTLNEEQEDCVDRNEKERPVTPPLAVLCLPSTNPVQDTSTSSKITQDQPWSMNGASECGTCGRWFSSPRKRDKHELTHLLEFVCLLCRASFPSQTKLEDHQRSQHQKTKSLFARTLHPSPSTDGQEDMRIDTCNDLTKRVLDKGGPDCLGRQPLVRHTCTHCDKVCKTAVALNRHQKRHELASSPEAEDPQPRVIRSPDQLAAKLIQSTDADTTSDLAPSIPVINYPTPDLQPTERTDPMGLSHASSKCEVKAEHRKPELCQHLEQEAFDTACNPSCTKPSTVGVSAVVEGSKAIPSSPRGELVMNGAECLDFRTPEKRGLDALEQRIASPLLLERPSSTCPALAAASQIRGNAVPVVSMATKSDRGSVLDQVGGTDAQRQGDMGHLGHFNDLQEPQDLRVSSVPRSPSNQAQDLSMPTILARERELSLQAAGPSNLPREHATDTAVTLLVPKQEPLSPVPSPTCSVVQTATNGPSQRPSVSPHGSQRTTDIKGRPRSQDGKLHCGRRSTDRLGPMLPTNLAGVSERPSAHALLLPRATPTEPVVEENTHATPTHLHRETGYPIQEFPLPLIVPGGYRSGKKQEDNILMSYPAGPLPFGSLGKVVAHSDSAKLPFYPDPYHLLYGPQLLAYPYNIAALPMALNMMVPGDKVEPLPFLPALFNYTAPYTGTMPHHLMVNPSLYNSSSGSGKKRDSTNP